MTTTSDDFVMDILKHAPPLTALYETHLAENRNLLPHVFMTDVTAFIVDQAGRLENPAVLGDLLGLFEGALMDDGEVAELVAVSFVENLIGENEALTVLKPLMGPRLRAELDRVSSS